jgi:hypothetical protein
MELVLAMISLLTAVSAWHYLLHAAASWKEHGSNKET